MCPPLVTTCSGTMPTPTLVPDIGSQETVSSTTTMTLLPVEQLTALIDHLQDDDVEVTEENGQLIVTLTLLTDKNFS